MFLRDPYAVGLSSLDQYFTPDKLAAQLAGSVSIEPEYVADYAVGDGQLLKAATRRWPKAHIVATDRDAQIVRTLQRDKPSWSIGKCDFLNYRSQAQCRALKRHKGKIDLILLNPPFSCKGGARHLLSMNGVKYETSLAFAFLAKAIEHLADGGQLVSLMPYSCLKSEKDRSIREGLSNNFDVEISAVFERGAFEACTPRTALLHLSKLSTEETRQSPDGEDALCATREIYASGSERGMGETPLSGIKVSINRGAIQMHTVDPVCNGYQLVHSTELRENGVRKSSTNVKEVRKATRGPAVLVPRVGKPSQEKVALYLDTEPIAITDCVISMECETEADAMTLQKDILAKWNAYKSLYDATCAPYITLRALRGFLKSTGCKTESAS